MIIRFFGYVLTFVFVLLMLLLGFVCMGCNSSDSKIEDTSMGLHRLHENWNMKRYQINKTYEKNLTIARVQYWKTLNKYWNLQGEKVARYLANEKEKEYKSKAWRARQVSMQALEGIKFRHFRFMLLVKYKPTN